MLGWWVGVVWALAEPHPTGCCLVGGGAHGRPGLGLLVIVQTDSEWLDSLGVELAGEPLSRWAAASTGTASTWPCAPRPAWKVETAKMNESPTVEPLLDKLQGLGINPETCALDKGYDGEAVYEACSTRGIDPVICLKQTPAVKRGDHKPPTCEHGEWQFAGADRKRGFASGAARPGSASPRPCGSRPTGSIPSSRARRFGGRVCIGVVRPWSARSGGSRTNGLSRRSAYAGSSACASMPTSQSSPSFRVY